MARVGQVNYLALLRLPVEPSYPFSAVRSSQTCSWGLNAAERVQVAVLMAGAKQALLDPAFSCHHRKRNGIYSLLNVRHICKHTNK